MFAKEASPHVSSCAVDTLINFRREEREGARGREGGEGEGKRGGEKEGRQRRERGEKEGEKEWREEGERERGGGGGEGEGGGEGVGGREEGGERRRRGGEGREGVESEGRGTARERRRRGGRGEEEGRGRGGRCKQTLLKTRRAQSLLLLPSPHEAKRSAKSPPTSSPTCDATRRRLMAEALCLPASLPDQSPSPWPQSSTSLQFPSLHEKPTAFPLERLEVLAFFVPARPLQD